MHDSGTSAGVWPAARGSRQEFVDRYGAGRADRFGQAFWTMDPKADALFTSGHSVREVMSNLRDALGRGEAGPDTFPEVAALVEDMRSAFDGVDWEKVERGRRVYLSIPPLAHGLALGPGSLVHTYATPSIADLLVRTGELTDGAVKRLAYTTNWIWSLFVPDSLRPGGQAFVHSGMVRTMHAHVRRVHLNKGLDHSAWGAPINEFDVLRTWLDFTIIPYKALRNMGWSPSAEEIQDVFYVWRVVGRMIGLRDDLMAGLDDIESTQETLDAVDSLAGQPNDASQALVDALMSGFVVNAQGLTNLPEDTLADWTVAHVRIIHGDEVADSLSIPTSLMQPILQMEAPAVAERYSLLRANEQALQAEIEKNEAMLVALLSDDTSYNKQEEVASLKNAA